eukprot:gnl/TRDRNA2_/TRDRNA2_94806_c0_seq1.p1 gnl/TRDRNA2_/TRDRNA2_94806_c0~~gnl/TRDRNA2_/TRDRNA2_94806_c0_seq1.p1  ORF type:complete len:317 (+),score=49.30 gnl/TRDRNA2_/TRDRNA2_94806_c0_seq1:87-1037(+)
MSTSLALSEPLFQEAARRNFRCSKRLATFLCTLIGVGVVSFVYCTGGRHRQNQAVPEEAFTMGWNHAPLTRARSFLQPTASWPSLTPERGWQSARPRDAVQARAEQAPIAERARLFREKMQGRTHTGPVLRAQVGLESTDTLLMQKADTPQLPIAERADLFRKQMQERRVDFKGTQEALDGLLMQKADAPPSNAAPSDCEGEIGTSGKVTRLKGIDELENAQRCEAGRVLIFKFYAPWCAPCRLVGHKLAKMAKKFPEARFFEVNYDENTKLFKSMGIDTLPFVEMYRGAEGKMEAFTVGPGSMKSFEAKLQTALA